MLDLQALNEFSDYWEQVRAIYSPFDTAPKTGSAEVYLHEMPGGQYTNLWIHQETEEVISCDLTFDLRFNLRGSLFEVERWQRFARTAFDRFFLSENDPLDFLRPAIHRLAKPA